MKKVTQANKVSQERQVSKDKMVTKEKEVPGDLMGQEVQKESQVVLDYLVLLVWTVL